MKDETRSSSRLDLPKELVIEILSYLPVKSLLKYTCVCKSWLRLIKNDPQFAIKHYVTRATSYSHVMDKIDYMITLERSMKLCVHSLTETKTFRCSKKFDCVPNLQLRVLSICHGVICFDVSLISHIMLCNPSIHEVVMLPISHTYLQSIQFGFDHINNDYKIIRISRPTFGLPTSSPFWTIEVYSVRFGHWSNPIYLGYNVSLNGDATLNANGRMCNWMCYLNHEQGSSMVEGIITFDMANKVLKECKMPGCVDHKEHQHQLIPSSRWQICLSCYPSHATTYSFINIWVLHDCYNMDDGGRNGGPNSNGKHAEEYIWSKQLSIRFPEQEVLQPLNFWLNDDEILVVMKKASFEEIVHYDVRTQQLKPTGRKMDSLGMFKPFGYAESLVSIKELISSNHEPKQSKDHDKHDKGHDHASEQEDDAQSLYLFREVGRKGVRWSHSFKLV